MLDFRLYEPDDFDRCIDLLRRSLDADYTPERFRWLHHDGPWGPSRIVLAVSGDRVVGIYSVIPKLLDRGGERFLGGRDVDPVVDPDFRGQGLFGRLLGHARDRFDGIEIYFNFANPVSFRGFAKAGWQVVKRLPELVHQTGHDGVASKEFVLWAYSRLVRPRGRSREVREVAGDEVAAMLDREPPGNADGRLGVLRTPGYLKWRYVDHPMNSYRFFRADGAEGGFNLAVCREHMEAGKLAVVDLVSFGPELRLGDWLALWSRDPRFRRVTCWDCVPGRVGRGFFMNPMGRLKGLPLLVRPATDRLPPRDLLDPDGWFVCRGDVEVL